MARTYTNLTQYAQRWLQENDEVTEVVIRRKPEPPPARYYTSPRTEAYARMPEACPIVGEILSDRIPATVEDMGLIRDQIANDILNRVTEPFRDALIGALEDKHKLIRELTNMRDRIDELLCDVRMRRPDEPPSPRSNPTIITIDDSVREEEEI